MHAGSSARPLLGDAEDTIQKRLASKRKAARIAIEDAFEAAETSGTRENLVSRGWHRFQGLLGAFCRTVRPLLEDRYDPRELGWYKQGWRASDFFYNSPGQPKVAINTSLRFIHEVLSPPLCTLFGDILGRPVKMVQGNVCKYSAATNRCLENHRDGCPFSAIVHVHATDPATSGLHIQTSPGGEFDFVGTPNPGDVVVVSGDRFLHRSCRVKGEHTRTVIVFFLEYADPKEAKREAEHVARQQAPPGGADSKEPPAMTTPPTGPQCPVKRKRRLGYVLERRDRGDTPSDEQLAEERGRARAKRRKSRRRPAASTDIKLE